MYIEVMANQNSKFLRHGVHHIFGMSESSKHLKFGALIHTEEYYSVDLGVAAVKSTWPLQVKSSRFSSMSPPKFSTQVVAEF